MTITTVDETKNTAEPVETDVEYVLESVVPKNVGHLLDEPLEFECPACHQKSLTRVVHEAATCLQKFIAVLNFCLCCKPIKWSGRHDVNHYCSKCGCYIGRKITLSWHKKKLFKIRNDEVEDSSGRWQKFHKIEKERLDQNKQKYKIEQRDEDEQQQTQ